MSKFGWRSLISNFCSSWYCLLPSVLSSIVLWSFRTRAERSLQRNRAIGAMFHCPSSIHVKADWYSVLWDTERIDVLTRSDSVLVSPWHRHVQSWKYSHQSSIYAPVKIRVMYSIARSFTLFKSRLQARVGSGKPDLEARPMVQERKRLALTVDLFL